MPRSTPDLISACVTSLVRFVGEVATVRTIQLAIQHREVEQLDSCFVVLLVETRAHCFASACAARDWLNNTREGQVHARPRTSFCDRSLWFLGREGTDPSKGYAP